MNNEELQVGQLYLCRYLNGNKYVFKYLGEDNWSAGFAPEYFKENKTLCLSKMTYSACTTAEAIPLGHAGMEIKPARCIN